MCDLQIMSVNYAYSIVVVGAMNPSIHHPFWYHDNGIISSEEFEHSTSVGAGPIVSPPLSRFSVAPLNVECQEGRWQVATDRPEARNRLLDVTLKTFDDCLFHTPITAVGLNFDHMIADEEGHLAREIGRTLSEQFDFLPSGKGRIGGFVYQVDLDGHVWRINAQRASDDKIWIRNNFHLPAPGDTPKFRLADLIGTKFREYYSLAVEAIPSNASIPLSP